jgi:peptidoglycan/LPS O-acetylase OafA/YrhL
VLAFYRRRFQRVVPCAFIITTISYGLATWVDIPEFFSAITFFPYWLGADTLWYVPFVLTLYLVYPLVHRLQKKCPIVLWVLWAVLLAFSALCCYILVPENSHWLLPIMRFPLFILGCILAPWADGDSPIPRWAAPATLLGYLLIVFFWPNYKSDEFARSVSYVFLSGFVIIALTWLARLFTRGGLRRFIYRCFALCVGISLEIYLIYSRLLYFMEKIPAYASGRIGHVKLESVTFVLTIILSLLLNRFCAWLTDSFSKIPVVSDD